MGGRYHSVVIVHYHVCVYLYVYLQIYTTTKYINNMYIYLYYLYILWLCIFDDIHTNMHIRGKVYSHGYYGAVLIKTNTHVNGFYHVCVYLYVFYHQIYIFIFINVSVIITRFMFSIAVTSTGLPGNVHETRRK